MKKIFITLLLLPILSNCSQYTAMIGPSYTLAETGNFLQATTSLSRSIAANNVKSNLIQEVKSDNYCETFHTSELNQIFFETLEEIDCVYDPMSKYR